MSAGVEGGRPRALVASHVPIADSRPSKQVRWLESAGYQVDTLSRGGAHPAASGRHFEIGFPSFSARILAYLLFPSPARFRFVVGDRIPVDLLSSQDHPYDLLVVHDMELLPWAIEHASALTSGPVLLDLHEYFEGYGVGLSFRLLFARYHRWLFEQIADPTFTVRSTVADGIADLYRERLGFARPIVLRNTPAYAELEPSPVDPSRIRLVYHGRADLSRGLDIVLDALRLLDSRFDLTFMVVGDATELRALRKLARGLGDRVHFRDPVPMPEVARAINEYDAEIVFYPPNTNNLRFFLPNKFFEAIQARLAIVAGESPSIAEIVREFGNGRIVTAGWTAADLAEAIRGISADELQAMKVGSGSAARRFNAETERERFLEALGVDG